MAQTMFASVAVHGYVIHVYNQFYLPRTEKKTLHVNRYQRCTLNVKYRLRCIFIYTEMTEILKLGELVEKLIDCTRATCLMFISIGIERGGGLVEKGGR